MTIFEQENAHVAAMITQQNACLALLDADPIFLAEACDQLDLLTRDEVHVIGDAASDEACDEMQAEMRDAEETHDQYVQELRDQYAERVKATAKEFAPIEAFMMANLDAYNAWFDTTPYAAKAEAERLEAEARRSAAMLASMAAKARKQPKARKSRKAS